MSGLFPSPWPAEDGGPTREQAPAGEPGLALGEGERLVTAAVRQAFGATMLIRRAPGELFLLRCVPGARPLRDASHTLVERLDPDALDPIASTPPLEAGPFWPGGLAALADGGLVAVAGRWVHRLDPSTLAVERSRELPDDRPHNSFVALPDGTLVLKDIDRDLRAPATVRALDPGTLADRDAVELHEPVVARLSAHGDDVYAVGIDRVHRLRWDPGAGRLSLDREWAPEYRRLAGQGHGWDPVIAAGRVWFLDQGRHRFRSTMRGAGLDRAPVRLHSIAVDDARDHHTAVITDRPYGAVTNPPLVDAVRGIALGYDSAAGVLAAFDAGRDSPRWVRSLNTAGHLLRYPDTGEVVAYHQRLRPPLGTRPAAVLLERAGGALTALVRRPAIARAIGAATGEDVVVLDLESGEERGRARVPAPMQSVCFPAPGWRRDVYYCSLSTVARIAVSRGTLRCPKRDGRLARQPPGGERCTSR